MARNFVRASSQFLEASSAPVTAYPLTISCWFWSSNTTDPQSLVALWKNDATNDGFRLILRPDKGGNYVEADVASAAAFSGGVDGPAAWTASTWTHAIGVFGATNDRRAYLNGSLAFQDTGSFSAPAAPNRVQVGARRNSGGVALYLNGRVADVAIWSSALGADDRQALARRASPLEVARSSLVFYAPLLGTPDPEPEYVGGRTLAVTGATRVDHPPLRVPFGRRRGFVSFEGAGGGSYALAADAGSYSLSGGAAGLAATRRLASDAGPYTLTGGSATLRVSRRVAADAGSYSLAGGAADLRTARRLAAGAGSYTLAGGDATLDYSAAGAFTLPADAGSYAFAGGAANLRVARRLSGDAGSYTLAGGDATLGYSGSDPMLAAEAGAFTLAGGSATLVAARRLSSEAGAFTLSGGAANLRRGRSLPADAGAYSLSAGSATLARTYALAAAPAAYSLAGGAATLAYSAAAAPRTVFRAISSPAGFGRVSSDPR